MMFVTAVLGILDVFTPNVTHAAGAGYIDSIVSQTNFANSLSGGGGGSGAQDLILQLISLFLPMLQAAAFIALTIEGVRMVISQDDGVLDEAKKVVGACAGGLILSLMVEPLTRAFLDVGGGNQIISGKILSIADWSLALAGSLTLVMIVVTGLKALASPTSEEGITNIRNAIFSVIAGIVVIGARFIISDSITSGDPSGIVSIPIAIAQAIFGFLGLFALAVIVYAGFLMVVNYGRDDQVSKAKGLLQRAILGLVIFALGYTMVTFVIGIVAG
jgi:hypothetical protein